ncbi:MBL fold metallo-hydrolase [Limosilactobacillus sp. STM2_1]|uniref:MBL fold metallo-hydrolase n=1 Tax=Limosilactobacillus rudii TaxID=2759755 RepID=A0A7W3YNM4_9LACO|nr:MBL fold metallo-hydrolase [Limosilactobacillus rudii]MBB1079560.1 MBL fold metallo-hydrolase [Limosilactobacillus rudii]MBB1097606.1 MBL fold metallo-hydrolase [Limosilactobacillus rudii]MCD7134715.1 MBL fold metallo-hydrolase [Limosilactobacillus rudii]
MRLYVQPVRDVFQTNSYFYINEENQHGCLIDPGAQADVLLSSIEKHSFQIDAILLTHGHFDHTGAVDQLTKTLEIPYYIHQRGPEYLKNDDLNLAKQNNRHIQIDQAPRLLKDGDYLNLAEAGIDFKILYTPGHSFDSVTYYDEKNEISFVGDVLYNDGPGIWQFPGGNKEELMTTIKNKLCPMPTGMQCFVGHTMPMQISQVRHVMKEIDEN